jgi:hypothetical protein
MGKLVTGVTELINELAEGDRVPQSIVLLCSELRNDLVALGAVRIGASQ